ncbi:fringe glycosyltransferase-like [Eriocheir sinensis]|uniref:fringe glycosyltransferase-like n=1 Tax=Eriocheir sinensis TaxID=95602 RepID=UPI0021C93125|nr:fringe glycosyltransferase-like [Eriocheir sinensis]
MRPQEKTMRLKIRSVLQQAAAACGALTVCVLVLQNLAPSLQDSAAEAERPASPRFLPVQSWPERAPRSLGRDYEAPAAAGDTNSLPGEGEAAGGRRAEELEEEEEAKQRRLLNTLVATATAQPATSLDDVFITVKTTRGFHHTRLDLILQTWFNLARQQTWFFTDVDDEEYQRKTGGHLINTNCSASHNRRALCCKMAAEFDAFLNSDKKWWCHFDDDNYVNAAQLVTTLADYDPLHDWYLGKPSIRAPLEIINRDNVSQRISFWFATGGAGFCISRSLALKMMPIAGGGKFISVGEKIRLPDDVTMGYIIEHLLKKKLTVVDEFHSHLEPMRFLNTDSLGRQVSFSYSQYGTEMNVLPLDGLDPRLDPTRMLSLHCKLYPNFKFCPST